jgi:hypothetical protein
LATPKRRPADQLARATHKLASLSPKCIAVVVEHSEHPGRIFMILMACPKSARCAKCDDARAPLGPAQRAEAEPADDGSPEIQGEGQHTQGAPGPERKETSRMSLRQRAQVSDSGPERSYGSGQIEGPIRQGLAGAAARRPQP